MNAFDLQLFHAINQHAGHVPILDPLMAFIAHYGLEIYGVLFVIAWFVLPRREEKKRHALIVAVFGGIIALAVNFVIGTVYFRPRPFMVPSVHAIKLIPHASDTSFPSDHVSGGFGFTSAAWGHTERWVSRSFLILSLILMFARVYTGVHWPTDVIAGLVVGLVCGRVAHLFSRPLGVVTRIGLRIFRMGRYAR